MAYVFIVDIDVDEAPQSVPIVEQDDEAGNEQRRQQAQFYADVPAFYLDRRTTWVFTATNVRDFQFANDGTPLIDRLWIQSRRTRSDAELVHWFQTEPTALPVLPPLVPEKAHIALPTGPGFNVQLDPAKIESQTILKPN